MDVYLQIYFQLLIHKDSEIFTFVSGVILFILLIDITSLYIFIVKHHNKIDNRHKNKYYILKRYEIRGLQERSYDEKEIMATILGTAMLLTAVSFTGCGRSVKDSTSAKTEKTTKETKRDEKIEIKITFKIMIR